ncbi:MAG: bifunctional UDP-N-acetylmuramoyl-L-alanyl-D-glutamate--2,6-diaminopimelate ligase MurE/UDP-N-acetylmuramoyl-tripeptide--D-alanyl-D-alanine ligase MurF [Pusillimonas sp.]
MTRDGLISTLLSHVGRDAHLCLDSRQVGAGDVFFALSDSATDVRQYIGQAIRAGAAAVLAAHDTGVGSSLEGVPVIVVQGLAAMMADVAHEWYGRPSEAVTVVAVTGTNGKTSTVQWLAQALNAEDVACGTIGTLGVTLPDGTNLGGALTTPDVLTLHRSLAALRDAGAKVVALEASSIGIDQGRLQAVTIEIAAFTNLTHDHLDYHGTVQAYVQAKRKLFQWPGLQRVVINLDDAAGRDIAQEIHDENLLHLTGYSIESASGASVYASDIQTGGHGIIFNLVQAEGVAQIVTRLVGRHNISNLLLVAGVLQAMGWALSRISRALVRLQSVDGRLQVVESVPVGERLVAAPMAVVDYAHTPDALARSLEALREVAQARGGKLWVVFGCGGDRDRAKRPMMGEIAHRLADQVVLTSDNPRSESPAQILEQIIAGMSARPVVIKDRADAILSALWQARAEDVVLLAGKGHETYQEINGVRYPFDDREWARAALTLLQGPTVSTDSRAVEPGQLFLALKGESFDAHDYLGQVEQASACAAIVERRQPGAMPQIVLGDTRVALTRLGQQWRRRFTLPAIAVTGSNGKTTTKEMLAAIMRAWVGPEAALATSGNYNNDIGVPLTLLRLRAHHRAAVFELGMNHPGEIASLAGQAAATVALVNNAQREHQEFMHTVEAVARENGAALEALPSDGIAVFPGDDTYSGLWSSLAGTRRTVRFGLTSDFDVYADHIHAEPARTRFSLHAGDASATVELSAPGRHNLRNALAAAACAMAAGTPLAAVVEGLKSFNPVKGRMQPHALADGYQLIDDSYNANPDSVRAAIDVLASLAGRKVLVLGGMAEVGENGPAMHAEVGAYARAQGVDHLLTLGQAASECARAFGTGAEMFDQVDDLLVRLRVLVPANILVKGSRSSRMERVVLGFQKDKTDVDAGGHHAA